MKQNSARLLALTLILPLVAAFLAACEVSSSDTAAVAADASGTVYDFSGLYYGIYTNTASTNDSGVYMVHPLNRQSGTKLTWMRVVQNGTGLQAYDNTGQNWFGSLSSVGSGSASFELNGATTAGAAVTIVGSIAYSGGNSSGNSTIDASWLEPGFSGNFAARASITPPTTGTTSSVTLSPSSATLSNSRTQSFTATGGNPPYTWRLSTTSYGSISTTTGSSTTFTCNTTNEGNTILTVTDASAKTASATIECN